ncbi:anhydro-N-acetylmuramic acid kinase [Striga asiatica]|uniref:Anhydro-N-acetylmuramic acid kinase n=1 Tax=Striga asiatica TaxID=4170 RepID=A0A5A7QHI0_STRAF|nr:anhydro-N-acetylmuramic acid kinase [Striga asiatica]
MDEFEKYTSRLRKEEKSETENAWEGLRVWVLCTKVELSMRFGEDGKSTTIARKAIVGWLISLLDPNHHDSIMELVVATVSLLVSSSDLACVQGGFPRSPAQNHRMRLHAGEKKSHRNRQFTQIHAVCSGAAERRWYCPVAPVRGFGDGAAQVLFVVLLCLCFSIVDHRRAAVGFGRGEALWEGVGCGSRGSRLTAGVARAASMDLLLSPILWRWAQGCSRAQTP